MLRPFAQQGFTPTLLTGVSQSSTVVQEEIFGPVLTIQTFRTTEEAIEKATILLMDLQMVSGRIKDLNISCQAKLKSGVVWSNAYNKFDPTSFGGYKESGKAEKRYFRSSCLC